jgi:hypothetical protein
MKYWNKKHLPLAIIVALLAVFVIFPGSLLSVVTTYDSPDVKILNIYKGSEGKNFGSGTTNAYIDIIYPLIQDTRLSVQVAQPQDNNCLNDYGDRSNLCLISKKITNFVKSGNDRVDTYQYTYLYFINYKVTGGLTSPEISGWNTNFLVDYKGEPVRFKFMTVTETVNCDNSVKCSRTSIRPVSGIAFSMQDYLGKPFTFFSTNVDSMQVGTTYTQKVTLQIESDKVLSNYYVDVVNPPTTVDAVNAEVQKGATANTLEGLAGNTTNLLIVIGIVIAVVIVFMFLIAIVIAKIKG